MACMNSPSRTQPAGGDFPCASRGVARPDDQTCVCGKRTHPPPGSRRRNQAAEADEALNDFRTRSPGGPDLGAGMVQCSAVAGELGFFADAAEHMQNYLELLPGCGRREVRRATRSTCGSTKPANRRRRPKLLECQEKSKAVLL